MSLFKENIERYKKFEYKKMRQFYPNTNKGRVIEVYDRWYNNSAECYIKE